MSKSQYDFFVMIVFYFCHLIFPWVMFTKLDADFTGCPRSVVAHTEITWKLYSLQVQYNTGLKSADIIKGVLYSSVYGYDTDPKHCKGGSNWWNIRRCVTPYTPPSILSDPPPAAGTLFVWIKFFSKSAQQYGQLRKLNDG